MAKLCAHGYFLEVAPRSCPKCRTDTDLALREEIYTLRATIERLREYARHKPSCYWWQGSSIAPKPCDCGYDELMKELEGTK